MMKQWYSPTIIRFNLQHFSNELPKQGHSCNCIIKKKWNHESKQASNSLFRTLLSALLVLNF